MESNYRNKDFEQYIKENADQYRMFPSEKVWKGINNTLHTRRKWYGAGLAFLLLVTGTAVTWVMMSYPVSKDQTATALQTNQKRSVTPSAVKQEPAGDAINDVIPFNNRKQSEKKSIAVEPGVLAPVINMQEGSATRFLSLSPIEQNIVSRTERIQPSFHFAPETLGTIRTTEIQNESSIFADESPQSTDSRSELIELRSSDRPVYRHEVNYPVSIESVTNAYFPTKLSRKVSWQLFVTPTISYRKLSENNSTDAPAYPFASLTDVNKAVTHKPDMGVQVGVSARYPVTKNLRIRGGLQFNVNRYDIKAFAYNQEVATINLSGGNGNNSVSTLTQYRTYNGYKSDWLKNFYFSVSAPIGVELKVWGNSKTHVGVAGTVQPTYIVKDRAYLISSDYKNYATVPWLIRHVNVNTGFETFVNYTSGKTQWQIGPQVRYQVLSSFHNKYPVKENLFDFGLKVGVSLNQ